MGNNPFKVIREWAAPSNVYYQVQYFDRETRTWEDYAPLDRLNDAEYWAKEARIERKTRTRILEIPNDEGHPAS